jgi:hypothetical protein
MTTQPVPPTSARKPSNANSRRQSQPEYAGTFSSVPVTATHSNETFPGSMVCIEPQGDTGTCCLACCAPAAIYGKTHSPVITQPMPPPSMSYQPQTDGPMQDVPLGLPKKPLPTLTKATRSQDPALIGFDGDETNSSQVVRHYGAHEMSYVHDFSEECPITGHVMEYVSTFSGFLPQSVHINVSLVVIRLNCPL